MACRRSRKKKSWVWNHFADCVDHQEVRCLVAGCPSPLVRRRQGCTTIMAHHLRCEHGITENALRVTVPILPAVTTPPPSPATAKQESPEELAELRELKASLVAEGWLDLGGVDRGTLRRLMENYWHFARLYDRMGLARDTIPLQSIVQQTLRGHAVSPSKDATRSLPLLLNPETFSGQFAPGEIAMLLRLLAAAASRGQNEAPQTNDEETIDFDQ